MGRVPGYARITWNMLITFLLAGLGGPETARSNFPCTLPISPTPSYPLIIEVSLYSPWKVWLNSFGASIDGGGWLKPILWLYFPSHISLTLKEQHLNQDENERKNLQHAHVVSICWLWGCHCGCEYTIIVLERLLCLLRFSRFKALEERWLLLKCHPHFYQWRQGSPDRWTGCLSGGGAWGTGDEIYLFLYSPWIFTSLG